MRSLWEDDVAAIGVGVPSVMDFASGRAKTSVNVPFADVPLRTILRERLGLPVFVDNDGACAALAEAHDGERMTTQNLCMFTVGTASAAASCLAAMSTAVRPAPRRRSVTR